MSILLSLLNDKEKNIKTLFILSQEEKQKIYIFLIIIFIIIKKYFQITLKN